MKPSGKQPKEKTANQIEAQVVKRRRRYASSVGKGYCQLTRKGYMCPDLAVKQLAGVDICQFHVDLLEAMRLDVRARVRKVAA